MLFGLALAAADADAKRGGRGSRMLAAAETVVETQTFEVTDPAQNFGAYATWDYSAGCSDGTYDLALRLTTPSGRAQTADNDPNCGEALWEYAPLETGTYTLEVVSQGTAIPSYDLLFGAGN